MDKFVALLFAVLLFGSCKAIKDKTSKAEDREITEQVKKTTFRKGDTVTYVVPNVILKDTVITKTNTVTGTTQVLRYDNEGRLTAAECISGVVSIIEESNRKVIEAIQESSKQKEEGISPSVILYAFIGFAFFLAIIGVVAWKVIGAKFSTITSVLDKIGDKVVK